LYRILVIYRTMCGTFISSTDHEMDKLQPHTIQDMECASILVFANKMNKYITAMMNFKHIYLDFGF